MVGLTAESIGTFVDYITLPLCSRLWKVPRNVFYLIIKQRGISLNSMISTIKVPVILLGAWQLIIWNIWVITKPPTRESDLMPKNKQSS
jgi:hypothetical protein